MYTNLRAAIESFPDRLRLGLLRTSPDLHLKQDWRRAPIEQLSPLSLIHISTAVDRVRQRCPSGQRQRYSDGQPRRTWPVCSPGGREPSEPSVDLQQPAELRRAARRRLFLSAKHHRAGNDFHGACRSTLTRFRAAYSQLPLSLIHI